MELKVEPVGPPALFGEGPFWDDETQTLYYIDAFRPTIYSYHPGTRSHHSVNVVSDKPGKPEVHTTFVIKIKGEKNKFVISDDKRLAVINWDGVSSDPVMTEHLVDVEQEPAASFCDGKCDPSNRLWAGTKGPVPLDIPITEMEKEKGSLYSLQRDKTVKMHLSKITLSNGLIWSPDKKKFYYIDSLKFGIDSYDYDDTTGSISNGKTIFCFKKNNVEGLPDGMTIDQEGKIWVACVKGGQMEPKVEPVGSPTLLGEGPYWDEETQTLYYIDVTKPILFSYKPETGVQHSAEIETGSPNERISFVIKIKDKKNKFVVSIKNRFTIVTWDGESPGPLTPQHLVDVESQELCHLNDGKCDPSHRLWAGSLGHFPEGATDINDIEKEQGSLYSMQKDKSVVKRWGKIDLSNGLAWSSDKKKFYFVDSIKYRIDSYDYDDATGDISNEKVVFCFKANNVEGAADGMTIDQEGMLWVACFNGYQVIRVDPNTGKLLQRVAIPSPNVTSVIFGGPNYEDLFVTTGTILMTNEQLEKYPHSGCIFRVTGLGVKGTPSLPVLLEIDI